METITIEIRDSGIIVRDGKAKASRLYAIADTLHIYKMGAVGPGNKDTVFWHCQNECIQRHIPLTMLKLFDCGCGRKKGKKPADPFLRGIWDELHCNICGSVLDADRLCPNCDGSEAE